MMLPRLHFGQSWSPALRYFLIKNQLSSHMVTALPLLVSVT
jgi:hypothetical protein